MSGNLVAKGRVKLVLSRALALTQGILAPVGWWRPAAWKKSKTQLPEWKAAKPGLTVAELKKQGAVALDDAQLKDLMVDKTVWIQNTQP